MSKIAIVTGANRGLGFEITRQLAQSGATVLLAGRDAGKAEKAATELREEELDVRAAQLDVTDTASARQVAEQIRAEYGKLDILINNAGIAPEATAQPAEAVDSELFRETFETNLFGAVNVIEHLLPLLRAAEAGRIVNVSMKLASLADQSDPDSPYYSMVVPAYQASKAALNSVTVGLAKSLAETTIKVNAVCPGWVQTDITPVNREQAPLTAADAAHVVVSYALVDGQGPTGGFFDREGTVAW